jgi:hypothetical protein
MIVIIKMIGARKGLVYISLVIGASVIFGIFYGAVF